MMDALTIQTAFMIFESALCFVFAGTSLLVTNTERSRKYPVMALNLLAGILLLSDSLSYIFLGAPGAFGYYMVKITNAILFFGEPLIFMAYMVYCAIRLFGKFSIKKGAPCRKRFMTCIAILAVETCVIISSLFNGIYFYVNEYNVYIRGPLFLVAVAVPLVCVLIMLTVLIEHRKKLGASEFWTLMTYVILPVIGLLFQLKAFGISYMDIGIGFSIIIMFIEGVIYKDREITRVARTEVRTGLKNEHACVEWLNRKREAGKMQDYAAIFFDLCKFSQFNKSYGTTVGDEILSEYAHIMSGKLKDDEILGRQYGNQFVAIVRKDSVSGFLDILQGVDVSFDDINGHHRTERVAARAGVYEINTPDIFGEDVIIYAGTALERAKKLSGSAVVRMTEVMMEEIRARRLFEDDIRRALINGDFEAYYQPKVSSRTGRICGAEALTRWYRDGAFVPTNNFISVMEANNSICELDFQILSRVCSDIKTWSSRGITPPCISVNFSRRNLATPSLASRIDEVVRSYGISKDLIEIEMTETRDEFPISVLKKFVDDLHALGYKVSIDDFGCASSSLSLLREISFDTMKIDKGFIDRNTDRDIKILSHIISMALSIDIDIVAEGVENESQLKLLNSMGVDVVQGFYYDKAMPFSSMTEKLEEPVYGK